MEYIEKTNFLQKPSLLSEAELKKVEKSYPDGITSAQMVQVFSSKGLRFSEATLRKYVQQGLLPRSQRVGQKGKHKGSRGIYPISAVRQINEIKKLMAMDYTIEEILNRFAIVDGEIEELKSLIKKILERLEKSSEAAKDGGLVTATMVRQLDEARATATTLIEHLETAAAQVKERAHIARDAV